MIDDDFIVDGFCWSMTYWSGWELALTTDGSIGSFWCKIRLWDLQQRAAGSGAGGWQILKTLNCERANWLTTVLPIHT